MSTRFLRSTRTEAATAVWTGPEKARAFLESIHLEDGGRVPVGVGSYVAEVVAFDPADYVHPRNLGALFESPAELLKRAGQVATPSPAPEAPTPPKTREPARQASFAFD